MAKKPPTPKPAAKTIKFGGMELPISNPGNVQPVSADLMTEWREFNGIVAVSFGSITMEGNGGPEVAICARLRMSLATATDLRNTLDRVLNRATPPKGTAH